MLLQRQREKRPEEGVTVKRGPEEEEVLMVTGGKGGGLERWDVAKGTERNGKKKE